MAGWGFITVLFAAILLVSTLLLSGCTNRAIDFCRDDDGRMIHEVPVVVHVPDETYNEERIQAVFDGANEYMLDHRIKLVVDAIVIHDYDQWIDISEGKTDMIDMQVISDLYGLEGRLHLYAVTKIGTPDDWNMYIGYAYTSPETWCNKTMVMTDFNNPRLLAHETGHLLGLGHVDDPTNIMHPHILDTSAGFTDEQGARMRVVATTISCTCGTGEPLPETPTWPEPGMQLIMDTVETESHLIPS